MSAEEPSGGVTDYYPDDEDVVKSATAAITEIRAQIDAQRKDAESLDTKAAAIFTATSAAAGVVVSQLGSLRTDPQRLAAITTFGVILILLVLAAQALRPRAGFSHGARPRELVAIVDRESHKTVLLSLADALVEARERNTSYLDVKQNWYMRSLRAVAAAALGIGWMVQTGALR